MVYLVARIKFRRSDGQTLDSLDVLGHYQLEEEL
jgi:hypothetical protein